jgi:hypothetical protein
MSNGVGVTLNDAVPDADASRSAANCPFFAWRNGLSVMTKTNFDGHHS